MPRNLCALVIFAAAACGTSTSAPLPSDSTSDGGGGSTDTIDDLGSDPAADLAVDSRADPPLDSADLGSDADPDGEDDLPDADAPPNADAPDVAVCEDGETTTRDCNPCYCSDGRWDCELRDCDLERCIDACAAGCPAPELQICGEDGALYCNECVMACFGVAPSGDPASCDDPALDCVPPPDAEPIEWTPFPTPVGCVDPSAGELADWRGSAVAETESDLIELLDCDHDAESAIDWDTTRIVLAIFHENPNARVENVYERAGVEILVNLVAPAYCGGLAPSSPGFALAIPAGELEVRVANCITGECEEYFP